MILRPLLIATLLLGTALPLAAADSAPPPTLTLDERVELVELLERAQAETLRLVGDVDPAHWGNKPAPERWSVGEVVEHLVLAEGLVQQLVLEMQTAEVDPKWREVDQISIPTLIERLTDRSQKFTAPEPLQPLRGMSREDALHRFLTARAETLRLVRETQAPIKAYTRTTPIGQPMTGRGWLAFIAIHNLRHNLQIAEVKATL